MSDPFPIEIDCRAVAASLGAQDEDFVLIDCREKDEHALVSIAGARLLPLSELAARAGELDPYRDRQIAVHCHHGGRSLKVAHWLRGQGFSRACSMAGGIDAWSQEIDPALPRY
jgi:rhodanese-related sulfurtransferase